MLKNHSEHINFIWTIANLLREPYRPPQYRKVMLPMTVLKRLDSVLIPTKEKVISKYEEIFSNELLSEHFAFRGYIEQEDNKRVA